MAEADPAGMSCRLCPGSRQGLDRRLRFVRRTARQVALRQIVARSARRPCRDLPQSARQRRFLFACPALCARLWPLLPASAGMRVRPAAGTASRGDVKKIDVSPEAGRSVSRKWTRRGYHGGRGSIRPGVLVQDAVRDFSRLRAQRRRQGPAEALAGSSRLDACQSPGQLLRALPDPCHVHGHVFDQALGQGQGQALDQAEPARVEGSWLLLRDWHVFCYVHGRNGHR